MTGSFCKVECRIRNSSSLFCLCNHSVATSPLVSVGPPFWNGRKLFKLLRLIIGLQPPSFLLTRKYLLINSPFWGATHWIAPFLLPYFLTNKSSFLLDSFLPNVGVNFDLVILKAEALCFTPIGEFVGFWLLFPNFLRNTAVFLLMGTLECWNCWTNFLCANTLCRIVHWFCLLRQRAFIEAFLTTKASEVTSFFLKIPIITCRSRLPLLQPHFSAVLKLRVLSKKAT